MMRVRGSTATWGLVVLCGGFLGVGAPPVAAQSMVVALGAGAAGSPLDGGATQPVRLPVRLHVSGGGDGNLAAIQGEVRWDAATARLDSARLASGAPFTLTANLQEAASGRYRFSLYAPSGIHEGRELVWLYFTPRVAISDDGFPVQLTIGAAGDELGRSLLPALQVESTRLCLRSVRCR